MPHSIAASDQLLAAAQGSKLYVCRLDGTVVAETEIPIPIGFRETSPNYIDKLAFTPDSQHLVGIDHFAKAVTVYNPADLAVVTKRAFPKRPSAFAFVSGADDLLVGDKFGDVYRVPLYATDPLVDAKGAALIEPILGHVSMLLDVVQVNDSIITSDRDEHIKISRLDKPYVIDRFLLGHESYVSALAVTPDNRLLVSGGGDNTLRFWNLSTGEIVATEDLQQDHTLLGPTNNITQIITHGSDQFLIAVEDSPFVLKANTEGHIVGKIEFSGPVTSLASLGPTLLASTDQSIELSSESSIKSIRSFDDPVINLSQEQLRKQPEF